MAQQKPRKEEEELMLEDGGIEESPRRSFEDCSDSEEDRGEDDDDDDEERERDGHSPCAHPRSYCCPTLPCTTAGAPLHILRQDHGSDKEDAELTP